MLRNYVAAKILENTEFQATPGQLAMIGELGDFVTDGNPSEIMLVKGYAGTGKTSLMRSLVLTLSEMKVRTILLAPTGRAAKVLAAYTGRTAWTIHKKIYRQKSGSDGLGEFVLDRNLLKNAYFIVDEASMIGEASSDRTFGSGNLLGDLMDYVEAGEGCRLILVGDTAQLPPVGLELSPALDAKRLGSFGSTVREIELTDVVRQSEGSGILHNASAIRRLVGEGRVAYPKLDLHGFPDLKLIGGADLLEAISASYDRYGEGESIVVTRSNKRANRFNAGIRSQLLWREEEISSGDMLMVVKNNYFWKDDQKQIDFIANGEIVRVERVLGREEMHGHNFAELELSFPDYDNLVIQAKVMLDVIDLDGPSLDREQQRGLYLSVAEDYPEATSRPKLAAKLALDPYFNALQVKFAYAITCHKSQGGQWKSVFIDQGYFTDEMLSLDYLRWLYTAFTRATDELYLVNFSKEFQENNF